MTEITPEMVEAAEAWAIVSHDGKRWLYVSYRDDDWCWQDKFAGACLWDDMAWAERVASEADGRVVRVRAALVAGQPTDAPLQPPPEPQEGGWRFGWYRDTPEPVSSPGEAPRCLSGDVPKSVAGTTADTARVKARIAELVEERGGMQAVAAAMCGWGKGKR